MPRACALWSTVPPTVKHCYDGRPCSSAALCGQQTEPVSHARREAHRCGRPTSTTGGVPPAGVSWQQQCPQSPPGCHFLSYNLQQHNPSMRHQSLPAAATATAVGWSAPDDTEAAGCKRPHQRVVAVGPFLRRQPAHLWRPVAGISCPSAGTACAAAAQGGKGLASSPLQPSAVDETAILLTFPLHRY